MENHEAGWGVRLPGFGGDDSEENVESGDDVPEIIMDEHSWRQLNDDLDSSFDGEPEKKKRRRESKEQRKRERRERHEEREERRERRARRREEENSSASSIVALLKNWAMPALKDSLSHEEMCSEWPSWRDMFLDALEIQKPTYRDWSEQEKFMALRMHGGPKIREVAAHNNTITEQANVDAEGKEKKFSNLVARCNASFRPRDVMMEITFLRAMKQKQDEPVREFMEMARKQSRLCCFKTAEERDKELLILLNMRTVDSENISKLGIGKSLEDTEALALHLEAVRLREKPVVKEELPQVNIYAMEQIWSS